MKKYVTCVISVQGFHKWRDAFDDVSYLRDKHRHVFQIELGFAVQGNDREVEIIDTQNKVLKYLLLTYGVDSSIVIECDFDNMSCEDIAQELLEHFKAAYVKVTEDGFGGSLVIC